MLDRILQYITLRGAHGDPAPIIKGWDEGINSWHKTTNPYNILRYDNKPPDFIGREFRVTFPSHSLRP